MTNPSSNDLSIAAVERETGLSKDTLRVWERRYQFPVPGRDAFGERVYPAEQVEKLRLIRVLMDQGHRPGKIVGADVAALRDLAGKGKASEAGEAAREVRVDLQHYIELCKAHQTEVLRRELSQAFLREGMYRFVTDVIAPLNELVGTHWADGRMAVFEEHLYTECVQSVMRNAIAAIPSSASASTGLSPRVLLTTVPHEQHGLGLLMSEAIFALESAYCISLGTQTPIGEIARAAEAQRADIIALSFSSASRPAQVLEALADLRAALPPQTEIWVGGRSAILQRRPPPQVVVLDLHGIRQELAAWRARAKA